MVVKTVTHGDTFFRSQAVEMRLFGAGLIFRANYMQGASQGFKSSSGAAMGICSDHAYVQIPRQRPDTLGYALDQLCITGQGAVAVEQQVFKLYGLKAGDSEFKHLNLLVTANQR
jgi:hypothetical protein